MSDMQVPAIIRWAHHTQTMELHAIISYLRQSSLNVVQAPTFRYQTGEKVVGQLIIDCEECRLFLGANVFRRGPTFRIRMVLVMPWSVLEIALSRAL